MEIKWDIKKGVDTYRQISDSRLKAWIATGRIKPAEMVVWRSGFSGWRKAEDLEELLPYVKRWERKQFQRIGRKGRARKEPPIPKRDIKNILIIDDEKDLCDLLSEALVSQGYQVSSASTGREAMGYLRGNRPDLVFLDLRLPGGDGIKLLSRIKNIDSKIIVNILTAYGSQEAKEKAIRLGVHQFIEKPFSEEEILRSIRS